MTKFNQVVRTEYGFDYVSESGMKTCCSFDLFLIRQAWHRGCDFEDLADGYGAGMGTHGDWSGIRDSSGEATRLMLQRALNYLFEDKPTCPNCPQPDGHDEPCGYPN